MGLPVSTIDACQGCRNGDGFSVALTMAFQPILDLEAGAIWGYEALVRGAGGESAATVLASVTDENRYRFDQACRVKAIELAGQLMPHGAASRLSINFMPNAVYEPKACIKASLAAAARARFDPRRLMFEFTENEHMQDVKHVQNIVSSYRNMGFTVALDDFGAGYAGLNLLARFQPDVVKVDMELVRGIDASRARQVIVAGIVGICRQLDIAVLAEGVETQAEADTLRAVGIRLFQGYLFARPELERFRVPSEIAALAAAA